MPTIAEQLLIDACATGFACTAQNDLSFRQSFLELLYQIQQGGGIGGGGTPGGPLNAVQFQSPLGAFAGSSDLTFDDATNVLTVATSVIAPLIGSPAASALSFASAGTARARFNTAGHFLFNADNTNDIGAPGGDRPRTGYFGTSVAIGAASILGSILVPSGANRELELKDGTGAGNNYLVAFGYVTKNGAVNYNTSIDYWNPGIEMIMTAKLSWSSSGSTTAIGADTALNRNAAGIVEVNNGTPGTFRDVWARHFRLATAFTVATLPAAGVAGRFAYVTDATAPVFLAALVGGGAVITPVFDNGAAWVSA